jgi:uncharacterized membrane protein
VIDLLPNAFSFVCGQHPDHIWAPGGNALPCCQRCTGLYLGALAAVLLHVWLKPRPTNRFLAAHGFLLLQMVPFGFHWLPQGPVLRTITGVLYGFGIVAFLCRLPAAREKSSEASGARGSASWRYAFGLVTAVSLIPMIALHGGEEAALILSWLAAGGALALAALVLANGILALRLLAPSPWWSPRQSGLANREVAAQNVRSQPPTGRHRPA